MKWAHSKALDWMFITLPVVLIPVVDLLHDGLALYVVTTLSAWTASYSIWRRLDGVGRIKRVWFYVIAFVVLYVLLVYGVVFYDKYLEYKLSRFDLNGDGVFSPSEQTPDQIKYMNLLINDTGRNLIPLTGIIYSLISTLLLFVLSALYRLFRKRKIHSEKA